MKIDLRKRDRVVVAEVRGQLVAGTGDQAVREVVEEVYADGWPVLLLDLSAVSKIDSLGIGELVAAYRLARDLKRGFALIQVDGPLRRTLDLGHLLPLIPIYRSEDEALEELSSGPQAKPDTAS